MYINKDAISEIKDINIWQTNKIKNTIKINII